MDDQEKPFDTASIVLLLIVSGTSDIADLATDLLFPIPVIGQVVFIGNSLVLSPIVWAIIQFSFIMKTGMGKSSLVAFGGGLGNMANIPGSETITTIIGITIANSPKAAQIASATSLKTGGKGTAAAGGAKAEAGGAGHKGVGGKEQGRGPAGKRAPGSYEERQAGEAANESSYEKMSEGEAANDGGKTSPDTSESSGSAPEFGETPTPFEELAKLTQETPKGKAANDEDEDVRLEGNKVFL